MKALLGAALTLCLAASIPVNAKTIVYQTEAFFVNASLGAQVFDSCTGSELQKCAEVVIQAISDTSFVVPFSVPGATGFENSHLSNIALTIDDPVSGQAYTANVLPSAGLFFSVDNTNGGAGFGSTLTDPMTGLPYGPTYPAAVFGTLSGGPFSMFTLTQDFYDLGFLPFCPAGTACSLAPPIPTDQGNFTVSFPVAPSEGSVSASCNCNVVVAVPEPASIALLGGGAALLVILRRRRKGFGRPMPTSPRRVIRAGFEERGGRDPYAAKIEAS